MGQLSFDIYAMVKPKSSTEIILALKEVISELNNINSILDKVLSQDSKHDT
jgi:hypothetical protein